MRLGVDDSRADHVVGIGIDAFEQLHTEAGELDLGASQVERNLSFEYFLGALFLTERKREIPLHDPLLCCLIKIYPPRFFHRAKNDSPFISVGSKNLLTVNGSLMIKFCGVPLYRNDKASDGESSD